MLIAKIIIFFKKSWLFLLLGALSFVIHFAFLSYPAQVVFDEVHFGKFVAGYFTHQYFFDIHPPLGKLMIAGVAKITRVNPVFGFEKIGEEIPGTTLFWLRFLPAFFGSLFILFFSWLAYLVSRSKRIALIAGFLILLDNAFLVQSKFILVDIFLVSFEVLTFCFFFLWQRQKSFSLKWFNYLVLTSLFFGLTLSIKWTGLATIGIIGVILFTKIFSKKLADYLGSSQSVAPVKIETPDDELCLAPKATKKAGEAIFSFLIIALIGFIVYIIPFYIHFELLPNPGPGDAFMSQAFQAELEGGPKNVSRPLSFIKKFTELNREMLAASASITASHPFGSRWYDWPIGRKPVYYWNQDEISGLPGWKAKIYLSGNPFLWWLAIFSLLIVVLNFFINQNHRRISSIFYILVLGYLANLLPFLLVKRVSFLYHYLLPAIFAILLTSFLLSSLLLKYKKVFIVIMTVIVLSFIIMAPLSYGWPMPPGLNNFETKLMLFLN